MGDIEDPPHDWNCLMKRNVTDDERFGELIQQNDNSGKNNQFDVFIFLHILHYIGFRFRVSGVSKQMTVDRKQKSDVVLHRPVFSICLLLSDLSPLTPDT